MAHRYRERHSTPSPSDISRREFTALAAAAPLALTLRTSAPVSASEVIDRVRRGVGVEWRTETVDGIKAGDSSTIVTGVVTTALATIPVLREAVKVGANLIVTCEPTFYARSDASTPTPPPDPILAAKNELIASQRLVVFRLRDHWRLRTPDPVAQALGDALGWTRYKGDGAPSRYAIPEVSLDALARHVKTALRARGGVRVIGDRQTRVRTIALLPGSTPITASLEAFAAADLVIAGEVREWESAEYVRDLVTAGRKKGLILTGRIVSEEPGMRACAEWLKTLAPEVPVRHVAAGDPYWRPE
jgi:putative NIF3 family GTP cyclohydrolase 1 type 2